LSPFAPVKEVFAPIFFNARFDSIRLSVFRAFRVFRGSNKHHAKAQSRKETPVTAGVFPLRLCAFA
jgi:hypothetical protein